MAPEMAPKLVKKMIILGSIFGSLFVEALELLGCLLGAFLGLQRLSWTALDPKNLKNQQFFKVFANAGFWVLEALNGPLGLILAPSWADLVPKWSPKWPPKWSKSGPKNDPKNDPQKSDF